MLEYLNVRHEHAVTIDGFACPKIEAREIDNGVNASITLDGRFNIIVPAENAHGVIWLIANALAIGEGYSCHGENSQPLNRHRVFVHEIEMSEPRSQTG